ncbi:hypothetical protein Tco_0016669 [Tanacetum coccineum]
MIPIWKRMKKVEFHEDKFSSTEVIFLMRHTWSPVVSNNITLNSLERLLWSKTFNNARHITAKSSWQGKITPLFDNMLVQPTQKEGTSSERLSEAHPTPSPEPTSEAPNESLNDSSSAQSSEVPFEQQPRPSPNPSPTPNIPDSIPEHTGENLGDHSIQIYTPFQMRSAMTSPKCLRAFNDDQVDASEESFKGTEDQWKTAHICDIRGDDETIATLLINMSKAKAVSKEKEKGVELKDVEDTDRPKNYFYKDQQLTFKASFQKLIQKTKGRIRREED